MAPILFLRTGLALWLLAVLSARDNSKFAKFKCQKEVSVCKNDHAEMVCSSTSGFSAVELYLCNDKKDDGKLLFNMTPVRESASQNGMQLKFEKHEAILLIQNTQFFHHGLYRWRLFGKGSSSEFTKLNVSEHPTISRENGNLICRATVVEPGRRLTWSNDLPSRQAEFTSNQDARGLFSLRSSQLWNDTFDSNPPCCTVVNERDSQVHCAQTCYTGVPDDDKPIPMANKSEKWLPITISIVILILGVIVAYKYSKRRQSATSTNYNHPVFFHLA